MNDIATRYLATWNATDADERRALIEAHWATGVTYVDPLADITGHDALAGLIEGVQGQFPDFVFSPVGEVEGHQRHARFQWGLGPAGAEPVVLGSDVVVLDDEGRIASVYGFLDKVPG
jgi:hypothetical protein